MIAIPLPPRAYANCPVLLRPVADARMLVRYRRSERIQLMICGEVGLSVLLLLANLLLNEAKLSARQRQTWPEKRPSFIGGE